MSVLASAIDSAPPGREVCDDQMRRLFEAAFDAIVIHEGGRILDASPALAVMLGYDDLRQLIGKRIEELVVPGERQRIARMLSGGITRYEVKGIAADGSMRDLEISSAVGKDGATVRVAAVRDISERKETEAALRESEENFRLLAHAAFDGVMVHDAGRVKWVNQQCAEMFGYGRPERMVGLSIMDLTHPDYHDMVRKGQAIRSEGRFESLAIRADGSTILLEICGVSRGDTDVRVVALRDLTERHETENRLVESERRYRELSEVGHALVCEHDLDGNIRSANIAVAHALGISMDELRSINIRDLIDPAGAGLFENYLETIARDGVAEGVMAIRTRSGERRFWHYHNALMTVNGKPPVVRGLARDVTEREEALAALRASEKHFRSLIENTSDIIAIIDRTGRLEYHSPSAERLLGYSRESLSGRALAELIHPDDAAAAAPLFASCVECGAHPSSPDIRIRHADGSWRWLSIVARCMASSGGAKSIILNARDVTDGRLLKTQLDQAQRLTSLGRLAATVAHEFNNVLMGMQPFAELLQRPGVAADTVAKGARHIASSIARGKHVALDILRFTQPAEPTIKAFDIREWWDRFAPEIEATTRANITLDFDFPQHLPVLGDPAQLTQLFGNLINNARDAMPIGGTLRVSARLPRPGETFGFGVVHAPEAFAQICVTDTGTGMSPHVKEHAFDPLFTTKQNGGTGLGLAVAHQIATRHSGSIFAESEVGVGTTFHVFLPLTEVLVSAPVPAAETARIRARRVLLVEDEQDIATGLGELLSDYGVETAVASTGEMAEPVARRFRPDVVLVDIGLPDIDGFEVGRRLRASWPLLRIVFISGHGDARRVPGVDPNMAFLQKPFTIEAVLATIADLESRSNS